MAAVANKMRLKKSIFFCLEVCPHPFVKIDFYLFEISRTIINFPLAKTVSKGLSIKAVIPTV